MTEITHLMKQIHFYEPQAHVTHHAPQGKSLGGYVVHVFGRELSGYHSSREAALEDAITRQRRNRS